MGIDPKHYKMLPDKLVRKRIRLSWGGGKIPSNKRVKHNSNIMNYINNLPILMDFLIDCLQCELGILY